MKYGMKVTTGETLQDFSPTLRFITCLFGYTTTQHCTRFFQMNTIPRLELTLHTEGKGSSLGIDCTCCSSREAFKNDKSFTVPYWKWTENKETCTICTEKHLGATNVTTGRVTGKFFTSWSVICTEAQTRGLTRMCNSSDEKSSLESLNSKDKKGLEARGFATTFPTLEDVNFALKFETFDLPPHSAETSCSFRNILEGFAGLDIDCQTFTPFITKFIYIWEVTWVMFRQQLMTPSSTFITRSSI